VLTKGWEAGAEGGQDVTLKNGKWSLSSHIIRVSIWIEGVWCAFISVYTI